MGKTRKRKTPNDGQNGTEAELCYQKEQFLAVRSEESAFYLCRLLEDVYEHQEGFRIMWYDELDPGNNLYQRSYEGKTDFNCILSNLEVVDKGNDFTKVMIEDMVVKNIHTLLDMINTRANENELVQVQLNNKPTKAKRKKADKTTDSKIKTKAINVDDKPTAKRTKKKKIPEVNGYQEENGLDDDDAELNDRDFQDALEEQPLKSENEEEIKVEVKEKPKKRKRKDKKDKPKDKERSKDKDKDKEKKKKKKERRSRSKKSDKAHDELNGTVTGNGIVDEDTQPVEGDSVAAVIPTKSTLPHSSTESSRTQPISDFNVSQDTHIPENGYLDDEQPDNTEDEPSSQKTTEIIEEKDFFQYLELSISVCNRHDSKVLIHFAKTGEKQAFDENLKSLSFEPHFIVTQSEAVRRDAIHMAISYGYFDIIPQMISILKVQPALSSLINFDCDFPMIDFAQELSEKSFTQRMNNYAKFALKTITSKFDFAKCLQIFDRELFVNNFIVALRNGNVDLVEHLFGIDNIQQLPDHLRASYGLSPLHIAAINPDSTTLSTLVEIHLKDRYICDKDGWLPIHYAAANKNSDSLKILLQRGCETNVQTHKGETCLHIAAKLNRNNSVKSILSYEKSIHSRIYSLFVFNHGGFTPLHEACRKGHLKVVKTLLRKMIPEDIEFRTEEINGWMTPLIIASKYGHSQLVRFLLNEGADPAQVDVYGRVALTHSIMNGNTEICKLLIAKNFQANHLDRFGNNLYHYALGFGWPLCYEFLLPRTHHSITSPNLSGNTAIHVALMKGYFGLIEDLLRKSVINVNSIINDSKHNLALACFSLPPSDEMFEFFERIYKKYHSNVNAVDSSQNNILHYFIDWEAKYQHSKHDILIKKMFKLLKDFKIDPWQANVHGEVPLLTSLTKGCELSFKNFVLDYGKSTKFATLLSHNETVNTTNDLTTNLLNYVILHFLDEVDSEVPTKTFGNEVSLLFDESQNFANLIRKCAFVTAENGDLPIEFFIRSVSLSIKNSPLASLKQTLSASSNFFRFLMKFYDKSFIQGINLLHFAVRYGCPEVVEIICRNVTYLNKLNEESLSPLSVAVQHNRIDNVRKLIEIGDRIFSSEPNQKLLNVFLAIENDQIDSFEYPLILANFQLREHKSKLAKTGLNGNSLYHLCCRYPHRKMAVDFFELLQSADLNGGTLNDFGETFLHVGFKNKFHNYFSPKLICSIMEKMPNLGLHDRFGRPAIHYIFHNDNENGAIVFLQSINSNLLSRLCELKDSNSETLLHYAIRNDDIKSVHLLKDILNKNSLFIESKTLENLIFSVRVRSKECSQLFFDRNIDWLTKDGRITETLRRICEYEWYDFVRMIVNSMDNVSSITTFIGCLLQVNGLKMANYLLNDSHLFNQLTLLCKQKILFDFSNNITFQTDPNENRQFLELFDNANIYAKEPSRLMLGAIMNLNKDLALNILKYIDFGEFVFSPANQPLRSLFKRFFEYDNIPFELFKYFIDLVLTWTVEFNFLLAQDCLQENSHCPPMFIRRNPHKQYKDGDNNTSNIFYSPLILAVIKSDVKIVQHLLQLKKDDQFLVNTSFCDSLRRSPLFHAAYNNDFEMIQLLFDRNYAYDSVSSYTGLNVHLSDHQNRTVFHILFDTFEVGHYYEAKTIFKSLLNVLESDQDKAPFKNILQQYTKKIANIDSSFKNQRSNSLVQSTKRKNYSFVKDLEQYLNDFDPNKITEKLYLPNILIDDVTSTSYEAMVTFNDQSNGNQRKVFTLIRITVVGEKYLFTKQSGQVGTNGRTTKIYFNERKSAIDHYCQEFYSLTKDEWSEHCLAENKRTISTGPWRKIQLKMFDFHANNHATNLLSSFFPECLPTIFCKIIEHYCNLFFRKKRQIECLNSRMLIEANDILDQILMLCSTEQSQLIDSHQLNELSDKYFSLIHVNKPPTDKVKLITDRCDVHEQYRNLYELKKLIFHREYLYCASKHSRQLQYFYETFEYIPDLIVQNSPDYNYVRAVIDQSIKERFTYRIEWIMRMNPTLNFEFRKRLFFWLKIDQNELLQLFVNGIQTRPIYHQKWELLFKAIHLQNSLELSESDVYWALCQVSVEQNEILICGNTKVAFNQLDNKKFLVEELMDTKCFFNFNDITFPIISQDRSNDYYLLSCDNIIPVYLIRLNGKPIS